MGRIIGDFQAFSCENQDEYGEMKRDIMSADDESLPEVLDKWSLTWRESDFPNMRLFIGVLNRLDTTLSSILDKFGSVLCLPSAYTKFVSIELSEEKEAEAEEGNAKGIILSILRFSSVLVRKAVRKDVYNSLEVRLTVCGLTSKFHGRK